IRAATGRYRGGALTSIRDGGGGQDLHRVTAGPRRRTPFDSPALSDPGSNLPPMEQRISLITLGVRDIPRARTFYEQLGWHSQEVEETVFLHTGGSGAVSR